MLNNIPGSITFSAASPDPFLSVTRAQDEPVLIYENYRVTVVDLQILAFYSK